MLLLFTSKVFVWIGKEANEEEKNEAVASGESVLIIYLPPLKYALGLDDSGQGACPPHECFWILTNVHNVLI